MGHYTGPTRSSSLSELAGCFGLRPWGHGLTTVAVPRRSGVNFNLNKISPWRTARTCRIGLGTCEAPLKLKLFWKTSKIWCERNLSSYCMGGLSFRILNTELNGNGKTPWPSECQSLREQRTWVAICKILRTYGYVAASRHILYSPRRFSNLPASTPVQRRGSVS